MFGFLKNFFQKNNEGGHFGTHLMIDGYGGSFKKLNNGKLVYKCLDELPGLVGMEKMNKPLVLEAPAVSEKDGGGYSGFVMINTSHISCHTFPKRLFASIDVYTCHDVIDTEYVKNYFKEAFGFQDLEINYVKRGTRYPETDLA